jgi:NDP-sugar pyrophosphorylase family protein
MINIVVPMAGSGSRFTRIENGVPKPLIQVVPGKAMIDYVIDYLTFSEPHRFIFVCLGAHHRVHDFKTFLREKTSDHHIVIAEELTAGPAASALLAESFIDNGEELLIAYCDMFLTIDMDHFIEWNRLHGTDGAVVAYPSENPMDSYAEIDSKGRVQRTAEKIVISGIATAGLYYFREGRDFVSVARSLISDHMGSGVEVFVSPCYNELIRQGKTVLAYAIARDEKIEMGTPEDLLQARFWLSKQDALFAQRVRNNRCICG